MATKSRNQCYLTILLLLLVLCSCNNAANKAAKERELIIEELTSYKSQLPYTIPGTKFTITDISFDNEIIAYKCSIYEEDWEAMSAVPDVLKSDRNLARVISSISNEAVDKFIENGFGLKYIYISKETGKTLYEIEMTSDKLKDIKNKVEKGEIEAYTILELAQMELSKLEIPSQVDDGVWITDAYIDGHNIYYIASIEAELDASALSSSDIKEMKESLIEGIKEEWLIMRYKKEMIKENVHFIYIYKDNRGKEFAKIDISPYEL